MAQQKPNILLITTDQQRFDTVAPYAPPFMRTPHFDYLSRDGIRFDSAYSDCPLCVPARVSIMTGKYAFNHGMLGNGYTSKVMGRDETLPGVLRKNGYQTIAVGKMHFGPQRARHGFDEMIIPEDYFIEMTRSGSAVQPLRNGLGQNEIYPSMSTVPENMTLTSWITEKCVDYIADRYDPTVPFFMWCSYSKPHPPFDPPEPYYSMYRNYKMPAPVFGDWSDDEHVPEGIKRHRQSWSSDLIPQEIIKEAKSAYYGMITQIDYNMGRLIAMLKDRKLYDNTLIIYTSDHGEYLGDHHCTGKFFFHDSSARVPFLIRMPKNWEDRREGTVVKSLVTHADIMPTILAASGIEIPQDIDGHNLVDISRNQANERHYLESLSTILGVEYAGITDNRWKYMWYPEGGVEHLFDLKTDPKELHNLAGDINFADELLRLRDEMKKRHIARNSKFIDNGELKLLPLKNDTETDRRKNYNPGLHTEYIGMDVRH